MAWSIGIQLGENVLEVAARSGKDVVKKRVLSAYLAPETALAQFLTQNNITEIDHIYVLTHLPLQVVEAGLGTPPAVLTTAGFENWLELITPIQTPFYSLRSARPNLPIERELIFGVTERTLGTGQITREPSEADLEFLAAKLELHQIKNVAICFMHSNSNPKNEEVVAEYLAKRGIQSFLSSANKSQPDKTRFWTAITNAYVTPNLNEKLSALKTVFAPMLKSVENFQIACCPIDDLLASRKPPLKCGFSTTEYLARGFAKTATILYCGMEDFFIIPPDKKPTPTYQMPFGQIAADHRRFMRPAVQPLSVLTRGFFSEMTFGGAEIRLDPGPMIFGRGLQPTFMDFLSLKNDLSKVSGLEDRIQEKGRARLLETLGSYVKNSIGLGGKKDTVEQVAADVLDEAVTLIALSIERSTPNVAVRLVGPLAPAMHTELSKHLKNVELMDKDFVLATAVLDKPPTEDMA